MVLNNMSTLNVMECELELARKIFWLLRNDQIFLTSYNDDKNDWDDGAYPAINCNDIFVPGADAEGLNLEDLDDYINVVKKWPNAGSQAWCAVKRSAKPWRVGGNKEWMIEYENAVAGIPEMLSH
jgi:hypothetical protein